MINVSALDNFSRFDTEEASEISVNVEGTSKLKNRSYALSYCHFSKRVRWITGTFSRDALEQEWDLISLQVQAFLGFVKPADYQTKFTILSQFCFDSSFPFRIGPLKIIKAQKQLLAKLKCEPCSSDRKIKQLLVMMEPSEVQRTVYPFKEDDRESVRFLTQEARTNIDLCSQRVSNIRELQIISEQIQLDFPKEIDGGGATIVSKRDFEEAHRNCVPLPKTEKELDSHLELIMQQEEFETLTSASSFRIVVDAWKALYRKPPDWLVDILIDKTLAFFRKQNSKKTLDTAVILDLELFRLHRPYILELAWMIERIPNTLRLDVEEFTFELHAAYDSIKFKHKPDESVYDKAKAIAQNMLDRILENYPAGLIPTSEKELIPDFDHMTVDLSSHSMEEFYGKIVRKAVIKRLMRFDFSMTKSMLSYAGKTGTFVFRSPDIFYYTDYSLSRCNQILSRVYSTYKDEDICPVTFQLMDAIEKNQLVRFFHRVDFKLCQSLYNQKLFISDISLLSPINDGGRTYQQFTSLSNNLDYRDTEDIVDALSDVRSDYNCDPPKLLKLLDNYQLFMTPQFLQHFDVTGITTFEILRKYVMYIGNQMGFPLVVQHTGNEITQKAWWVPAFTFECPFGKSKFFSYEKDGRNRHYRKPLHSLEEKKKKEEEAYDLCGSLKSCEFRVHYRRRDPYDINSPYILVRYLMAHSHPLYTGYFKSFYEDLKKKEFE